MELTTILNELHTLNGDQLRSLNRAVCNQMSSIRDRDSAIKRRTLRVKRKKAICDVGSGRNWDVPLSMLTAI